MKKFITSLALLMAVCGSSRASVIWQLQPGPVPVGPNFKWTYIAKLQPDQKIDENGASPTTTHHFSVLYDVVGFISATLTEITPTPSGTNYVLTIQNVTSPPPYTQFPPDNPSLPNIRVDANNSSLQVIPSGTAVDLYQVDILSTTDQVNFIFQSAQSRKNDPGGGSDGQPAGNTTLVEGPGVIPEPGTTMLMALGLVGIAVAARKVRR